MAGRRVPKGGRKLLRFEGDTQRSRSISFDSQRCFNAANPLLTKKITGSLSWIKRLNDGSGQFCKHPRDQTFVLRDGADQYWLCRRRRGELHICSDAGGRSAAAVLACELPRPSVASFPAYFIWIMKNRSEMEFHCSVLLPSGRANPPARPPWLLNTWH